eukprot:scaffold988_cov165-Ochromonas_danica.AAC.41
MATMRMDELWRTGGGFSGLPCSSSCCSCVASLTLTHSLTHTLTAGTVPTVSRFQLHNSITVTPGKSPRNNIISARLLSGDINSMAYSAFKTGKSRKRQSVSLQYYTL